MADFNVSVPDAQTRVDPIQPVQDNTAAQAVGSVGGLLGGLGAAVINSSNYNEQLQQAKYKSHALGELEQNILRNADLHDQGVISQDQARRSVRRLTAAAIANHPLLQDDINKLVGTTLSTVGLGADIATGTQQEQDTHTNTQKFLQNAQANGYGRPSDPPAVQTQMANAYQGVQLALSQIKQLQATVGLQTAQVGLTNANLETTSKRLSITGQSISNTRNNIGLQNDIIDQQATKAYTSLGQHLLPKLQQDAMAIVNDNTLTPVDKSIKLEQLKQQQQQTVDAIAVNNPSSKSSEMAKNMGAVFNRITDAYKDLAGGKVAGDAAQQQVTTLVNTAAASMASNNPEFVQAAAVSHVLPASTASLQQNLGDFAVKALRLNGQLPNSDGSYSTKPADLTHTTPAEKKDVNQYLTAITANLRAANSGQQLDPAHKNELNSNLYGMLNGLVMYGPTASGPADLTSVVQKFASPEFGAYITNPKNGMSSANWQKAQETYDQYYKKALVPALQDAFLQNKVKVGEEEDVEATLRLQAKAGPYAGTVHQDKLAPTPTQIHPVLKGGYTTFVPNDPTNQDAVNNARDLTRTLGPIIDTAVRADAHLHLGTDYDFWFNDIMNQIQPKPDLSPAATDLSLRASDVKQ